MAADLVLPMRHPNGTAKRTPVSSRRMSFTLFVAVLLGLLCLPLFADPVRHDGARARNGILDVQGARLAQSITLRGQWRLFWGLGAGAPTLLLDVPGPWAGKRVPGHAPLPAGGLARYSLIVHGLPAGEYSLYVPQLWAASRLSINGRIAATHGQLGARPSESVYSVRAYQMDFLGDGSDVRVDLDLSTFHHRDNGLEEAPVLGPAEAMHRWNTMALAKNMLILTTLFVLALYGLIIHLFRRDDFASLFFSLSCLSMLPILAIFSHDNLLLVFFPELNFRQMAMVQYLAGVPALGFMLAYVHALFPRESPRTLFWTVEVGFVVLFIVLLMIGINGDILQVSKFSQMAEIFRQFSLLYIVGLALAASLRGRDGALVFLMGVGTLCSAISIKALVSNGVISSEDFSFDPASFGAMALLLSQVVILAERWSVAVISARQLNDDLGQLLEVNTAITSEMQLVLLLRKIVQAASKIIDADRSSLFMHDARTNELWSLVAEGVTETQIRFPVTQGLAGYAFTSGELLNIRDAYADGRFHRGVDLETGYQTQSMLVVPITARDGRRLGVLQALNRRDGRSFNESDTARIRAFAAQAAVAIDNATLFAEVATERNYNENILRSMSSGVITLDPEARIVKLNSAAAEILGVDLDSLEGANARQLLLERNPQLIAEIDLVAANCTSKLLFDVSLATVNDRAVSVNLSIVPLIGDTGPSGILILIEDITEDKRLQSTMRRFMSQEVVDQVLGREGELLFGSACDASVLFADIRNFTTLSEKLDPRQTVEMLNEIFSELVDAVGENAGLLDKFIGDAVMATFGAPLPTGRDPANAAQCAIRMLDAVDRLGLARASTGPGPLRLGVGIASGNVVAGTIGSPKRMEYTVIGDSVNLAARLQDLTKSYRVAVIVCEATAAALPATIRTRELDMIRVRGRAKPERIFELLSQKSPCEDRDKAIKCYSEGRAAMSEGDWAGALASFERSVAHNPEDGPSVIMLERARALFANPPNDWDYTWPPPKLRTV